MAERAFFCFQHHISPSPIALSDLVKEIELVEGGIHRVFNQGSRGQLYELKLFSPTILSSTICVEKRRGSKDLTVALKMR